MRFPLTRAEIAAAFGVCCRCNKRVVELENVEEKLREDETLRDEEVKERLKKKEAENILIILDELKRIEAENIFNGDDWRELRVGYSYSRQNYLGPEFVEMDTPRECSYSTKRYSEYETENDFDDVDDVYVIETRILEVSTKQRILNKFTKSGAEFNGITPRQLRAIMAMIIRRCVKEKWRDFKGKLLTPDKVTLYDVNHYIILPFTVGTQSSFVQSLSSTAGPQPPRFFISHWWGETVTDFLECIERLILDFSSNDDDNDDRRGGGMTEDTPIWVCAYANNQWLLSGDITKDPKDSGFTKAMEVAEGRTITILDKEGIVFTRIWCIFELYLTLVPSQGKKAEENLKDGLWAVYTAHTHTFKELSGYEEERKAVGIISGGATSDWGESTRTRAREAAFPYELIEKSLSIQVESAKASVEDDRIHILNAIVGCSGEKIDDVPLKAHDNYVKLNNSLRGTFAFSTASLQRAAKEGDESWNNMMKALSNGSTKGKMVLDFKDNGPFDGLTAARATQLVSHLPLTIGDCSIWDTGAKYGFEFMDALIERVKEFHDLKELWICDTSVGDEEGGQEIGVRLAKIISTNTTIKTLGLTSTDLIGTDNAEQWGDALMKNNTLTELDLYRTNREIIEQLKKKTEGRTLKLNFV